MSDWLPGLILGLKRRRPSALTTAVSLEVELVLLVDEDPRLSLPLTTVSGDGRPSCRHTFTIALFTGGN